MSAVRITLINTHHIRKISIETLWHYGNSAKEISPLRRMICCNCHNKPNHYKKQPQLRMKNSTKERNQFIGNAKRWLRTNKSQHLVKTKAMRWLAMHCLISAFIRTWALAVTKTSCLNWIFHEIQAKSVVWSKLQPFYIHFTRIKVLRKR